MGGMPTVHVHCTACVICLQNELHPVNVRSLVAHGVPLARPVLPPRKSLRGTDTSARARSGRVTALNTRSLFSP